MIKRKKFSFSKLYNYKKDSDGKRIARPPMQLISR